MYPPHQHHPKRRKKRPIHGVKTVDVTRGKSGYGFTISGQHPCVLSCIVNNSPAERAGLRPGDYLMSVNGQDVSKFGHDEVVRMVGLSTGTLTIQVAENYNSSDSSDDEYHPRTKSKYPSRVKRNQRYGEKMEKLLSDINQRDRYCPDGHSHDQNSRPLPKTEVPKSRTSRPRLHTPVGAENHEILSEGRSLIEAGGGIFKVPFQKSASSSNVPTASRLPMQRVEPKQAFIKSTSHGQFRNVPNSNHPSRMVDNHMYSNFSPTSLQQIINHSLNSYSAANEAFILNEDDCDDEEADEQFNPHGGVIKIIVGYIGSLEMPGDANQPHVRIQSIRNAVRRLRMEQKIHTLVLMTVSFVGVKLTNMYGVDIALYPVKRLAFSGVCPDDRRFFGIVTLNKTEGDGDDSSDEDNPRNSGSSSCHVFMVDPEMTAHSTHAQKAKSFGITCTVDQHTQRCSEFPRSTTPIILSISNLYKDRPGGTVSNDVARSQVFASPNPPVERRSSSSSSNSNSDSGLGLGRDDNSTERIAAADIPPPPLPQRQPQLPQIKWSGNTIHLTQGPVKHLTPKPNSELTSQHRSSKSSLKSPQSANATDFDIPLNIEESAKVSDKLNIRAMPNPASLQTGSHGQLLVDGLEQQNDAENLRISMQKLLQARQKQNGHDQTSSDTESRSSRSDGMLSSANLVERPLSAPFKYLAGDTSSDLRNNTLDSTRSKITNSYSSDSNVADKLSPRAFLSSAFTPVGSVGSAFKKVRARPILHQLRSPSAPPIPSYHGDDEASDEDDMNCLIERFENERSFGLSEGDMDARRFSEGYALNRKRDQERKGVTPTTTPVVKSPSSTEKWINPKQESLRRKAIRKNPLSLSHESLVVFEQEPVQQKLSSANSVNSIVSHVNKTIEQEEVGRVAGWAVRFEKLLQDSVGIKVFTEFLKKEFSEENIEFWKDCEDYRNIIDANFRKSKAKEIFEKYVSVRGSNSVNIDSNARKQAEVQLENPTPQTFEVAQAQIFQLMKQDSFSRFLKSDLYKQYLMKEMEGKPLESDTAEGNAGDKGKNDKHGEKESKKKGKGKENEEYKEKRRRSLLPWRQNFIGSKKGNSKGSSESETKTSKSKLKDDKEKEKEKELTDVNSNLPYTAPVPSTDAPVITNRNARVEAPETIDEEPEQLKFCRVIMPDGSTTVVGAKQGQTINYVLGKMLDKRGLSIASVDVFLLGSDKPLNLNDDISSLGSKEVTVERRVLFRMDLPNKKSIGVKAKPNRMIRDVFKPILNKYGYRMDTIDVHLCGHTEPLHLEELVSAIDSQRVVVTTQSEDTPAHLGLFGRFLSSARHPLPNKYLNIHSQYHGINMLPYPSNSQTLDEITNEIFWDLMEGKSNSAHNFDELGILDLDRGVKGETEDVQHCSDSYEPQKNDRVDGGKDPGKVKTKGKVTFALPKNTVRNGPPDEDNHTLCERLKRAQFLSFDDQRGLAPQDLELPDFLRESVPDDEVFKGRESAPGALSGGEDQRQMIRPSSDPVISSRGYIEKEHDNFVEYSREFASERHSAPFIRTKVPKRSARHRNRHYRLIESSVHEDPIQSSNQSFSQDGILPSEADAESLFQTSVQENPDFNDPFLTDKSLTDIGFNYHYNKYLSKSRNFINCRPRDIDYGHFISNDFSSAELSLPDQTLRGEAYEIADNLDATLVQSPRSSPYSSDSSSSIGKENLNKIKSRSSRHTQIHSPVTAMDDDVLSAVDTDGHVLHSTPKTGINTRNAGMTPKVLGAMQTTQNSSVARMHTDAVTFV